MAQDELPPAPVQGLGSLEKAQIKEVIRSHREEIRQCYETALATSPNLAGTVRVRFAVDSMGQVMTSWVIESTVGDEEMETCVTSSVRTWVFPKPKGNGTVVVTYPFIFQLAAREGDAAGGPVRLDEGAILKVMIEQAAPAAIACFDSHRAELPALVGVVEVRFTIQQSGEVTVAEALGAAAGTPVGACLGQAVLHVRFPRQLDREITAKVPFGYDLRP